MVIQPLAWLQGVLDLIAYPVATTALIVKIESLWLHGLLLLPMLSHDAASVIRLPLLRLLELLFEIGANLLVCLLNLLPEHFFHLVWVFSTFEVIRVILN
mmetsp:Transcript_17687/g.23867  ORF Transcript_17687/g.23867 Transcript_17687/m.23867 type:complete len:100 (-) Transcript_17687:2148-2447(-)